MPKNYIDWVFPQIGEKACFLDIIKENDLQILNRRGKRIYGEIQSKKVYEFFKDKVKGRNDGFNIHLTFRTNNGEEAIVSDIFEIPCNFTSDRKTRIYLLPILEHIFYYDYYDWCNINPSITKLRFSHYKEDEFVLEFINEDEIDHIDLPKEVTQLKSAIEEILQIVLEQKSKVKSELKKKILEMDPYDFEKLIGFYFEKMDYKDVKVTSRSKDGGIDVIAVVRFGVNEIKVLIQAKKYKKNKVEVNTVRAMRGVLVEHNTTQGIIITTSDFTVGAREIATKVQPFIKLISGELLVEQLIDKEIGVIISDHGLISLDEEFFETIKNYS